VFGYVAASVEIINIRFHFFRNTVAEMVDIARHFVLQRVNVVVDECCKL
jgi:hypothetical protein